MSTVVGAVKMQSPASAAAAAAATTTTASSTDASRRARRRERRRRRRHRMDAVSAQSDDDGDAEERFETCSLTYALQGSEFDAAEQAACKQPKRVGQYHTSAASASSSSSTSSSTTTKAAKAAAAAAAAAAGAVADGGKAKQPKTAKRGKKKCNPLKTALRAALSSEEKRLTGAAKTKDAVHEPASCSSSKPSTPSAPSSPLLLDAAAAQDPRFRHRQAREGRVVLENSDPNPTKRARVRAGAQDAQRRRGSAPASMLSTSSAQHTKQAQKQTQQPNSVAQPKAYASASSSSLARKNERRSASNKLKGAKFRMLNEMVL